MNSPKQIRLEARAGDPYPTFSVVHEKGETICYTVALTEELQGRNQNIVCFDV
jgi:hypothetical protein